MAGAQAAVCHQTQDLELLKLTKIKLKNVSSSVTLAIFQAQQPHVM